MLKNATLVNKLERLETFFLQLKPELDYQKYCMKELVNLMVKDQ